MGREVKNPPCCFDLKSMVLVECWFGFACSYPDKEAYRKKITDLEQKLELKRYRVEELEQERTDLISLIKELNGEVNNFFRTPSHEYV
jgi:hypothetical protein